MEYHEFNLLNKRATYPMRKDWICRSGGLPPWLHVELIDDH